MKLGSLLLRLVVGGLFVGHGLQKLRGSFGGPGLDGTEAMMEQLEMRPAKSNALAAALTETAGGAAIVAGAGTPFAAAGLIATMTTAIRKVHFANGPWNAAGGYEYNAVLIAAVTLLAADGPGTFSVDALIGKKRWGTGWAVFALVAGIAGSIAAVEIGKRTPAQPKANEAGEPAEAGEAAEANKTEEAGDAGASA